MTRFWGGGGGGLDFWFFGGGGDSIFNAIFLKNYNGSHLGCLDEKSEISKMLLNFGLASGASEKMLGYTS